MIFVSSHRQTRLTALDIMAHCAADDEPKQFLNMPDDEMEMVTQRIRDQVMAYQLWHISYGLYSYGIRDQVMAYQLWHISYGLYSYGDQNLKHILMFGIGLHHAGLPESDRNTVEDLFCNNKIQILISTSTLAWGVNFPAHLVIVKGTESWHISYGLYSYGLYSYGNFPAHLVIVKGTEFYDGATKRYVDFPITDVLQMMGRAGRPQFDSYGKVCIFVHEPKKNFYKRFL